MPKATITAPGYMGKPWAIEGDLEGGLIIHKMGDLWALTHAASGMRPGCDWFGLKRDAIARRAALLALLPDWGAADLCDLALAAGFSDQVQFARAVMAVHDKENHNA
jgi:hypothetical protein